MNMEIAMRSLTTHVGRWGVLLSSILVVGTASAADVPTLDPALAMMVPPMHFELHTPILTIDPVVDPALLPDPPVAGMGHAIAAGALEEYRGGDQVDNTVTIDGRVTDNTADNIVSGSNIIQDGAFANASGISTVIQNSGSNVLIQNGMVVTVQFTAPGL